jgi:beta-glucanase (GH16 family)
LPGWKQVFYDDFQGESVSMGQFSGCNASNNTCSGLPSATESKWWGYPDGWPDTTKTCEYEPSQTTTVSGGVMNIYIHTSSGGACMTARPEAKLPNPADSSNGQLYGMYSVRMRSDAVPGYLAVFLLWPDSENWPHDGEIDFPDSSLTGTADAYLHYQGATSGTQQDAYATGAAFTSWHTYTIEWTPSYVKFLLDGNVVGDSTDSSKIPDTPMHWVLGAESTLNGAKPAASAQGDMQIAWASVWSYDPSTS